MGIKIHEYANEAFQINDEDFYDVDYWNGASYESRKISGATLKSELSGGSGGRFGIADTNGVYTYYSVLQTAINAASAGQTVEFFTDYVEVNNISVNLKNGVNLNLNGHTYTLANAGTANCIQDNGAAVSCVIANGIFKRSLGVSSTTNTLCLYLTGASNITCYSLRLVQDDWRVALSLNNVSAIVTGAYCIGANPTVNVTNGTLLDVNAEAYAGTAIQNYGVIKNCYGKGFNNKGILNYGTAYHSVGIDDSVTGFDNYGTAYNCVGKGYLGYSAAGTNIGCTGYSSAYFGILVNGATQVYKCSGYSTANYGIGMVNGQIDNCFAYSAVSAAVAQGNSGGTPSYINGVHAISLASAVLDASNANNGSTVFNSYLESKWNNAAGHGILVKGGNLEVANSTIVVANASANNLNATVAKTVKYANNVFKGATTPINANITQGMINVEDAQGNITI